MSDYVDHAVRHVMMRQGVLGVTVSIMLPHDPTVSAALISVHIFVLAHGVSFVCLAAQMYRPLASKAEPRSGGVRFSRNRKMFFHNTLVTR